MKATIQTDKPQQKVLHFGASDAWSMQFIGNWDEKEQEKVADWLFSTDNDKDGNPRGIGLSVWRFNLGAGSAEQGDEAQINFSTRTECLMRPDGTFDWTKQAAQRKFLKMAKERGVPRILAFLNSPPVYFTQNGLATNTGRGGTYNLRDDSYEKFARFMADAVRGIEEHDGVHIDYLCPVNEPDGHWNWTGPKQEGTPATNREIARIIRATGKEMKRQKLTTQVMADESSDLRCLLGTHETAWDRGYSLYSFFTKDSTDTYIGATPNVPRLMLAHSYWTNTPVPYMKEIRLKLREEMQRMGVGFWQTEICIMGNDEEIGGGHEYDFSMKTALYVATVARTYRKAIDDYLESPEKYEANMPWYLEQIKSCTYRQFTTGFFYGKPSEETQIYDNNTYEKGYTYLGIVGAPNEKGLYRMEQRNKFSVGEQIEIMKPNGDNVLATVLALVDEDGNEMESCPHPQQVFYVKLSETPDEFDILRRQENEAIALD